MDRLPNNNLALNILLGGSYFALAQLGFAWGALTSNATLVWPPSGLALFALLAFGLRVLPGLMIGAVLFIQWPSFHNQLGNTFFSFFVSTLMAISSIGQALFVSYWGRKWYMREFKVSTRIAITFTFIVLIGGTIAATFSNIILWQANIIKFDAVVQNWAVWWLGDCIGMLIVMPLLLWMYRRKHFYKNTQAHAFLIFCIGIGTVLFAVTAIGHNEKEANRKNWLSQASNLQAVLQAELDLVDRDFDILQSNILQNIAVKNALTSDDFQNLAEPLIKRNPWLESFSWSPNNQASPDSANNSSPVNVDRLKALTLSQIAEDSFSLTQIDQQDFLKANFIRSNSDNSKKYSHLGWRKNYLDKDDSPHPIINLTAYSCAITNTACGNHYLVSGELNLNSWMQSALNKSQKPKLAIRLLNKTGNGNDFSLDWKNKKWVPNQTSDNFQPLQLQINIEGKTPTLQVMGNEWQLQIAPPTILPWFLPSLFQITVLIIGIALTALLTAYLQALHKHDRLIVENQQQLEREIAIQTQTLRATNELLLKEIDEKQITQLQLKERENHLQALLDNIPDPIWFKSNDGVYLSCNKAVEVMFNRSTADIINKRADDFIPQELAKNLRGQEEAALASAAAVRQEAWIFVPQFNQHRLMDMIKIAVRDEEGNSLGILGIARDITEHYDLIDELEKFKQFAEHANEGFGIMTLTADTLYMNPSMNKMLNGGRDHNNYKEHFVHYYPLDIQKYFQENVLPSALLNGYWHGELAALHADGMRFPTKETFFIIRDDHGKPIYLGCVMSDISEQKKIESALQRAKETAEEATQAKSRFLANMSHEIRTPLNAVLGYSQLLMTDQKLTQQQHERMSSILNAGQRLLYLINDILDLSKIEAGALHVRSDYFDLGQELRDIIGLMSTKANTKGLRLEHNIQLPNPAIVKSDRQKIGQILLNLLGNAIKFTSEGHIHFNVTHENNIIHFSVIDTGPGIATTELQQLFSAFQQGKAGEKSGGTGLGLVISKHLAEHLGGKLELHSEPNKGTSAFLHLPLKFEHSTELPIERKSENIRLSPNSKCKALVVEDDESSRDLLVNLLQEIGCEVIQAANGEEGYQQARLQKPDIIFTDIRMPLLSGTELLQKLRLHIPKEQLPIVAVSASNLEHERSFYLAQGFNDFIGKPYQFSDIYEALDKFTHAEFVNNAQPSKNGAEIIADKVMWSNVANVANLCQQLELLQAAMNAGDMTKSKKLFSVYEPKDLGKIAYLNLANAIRQYDLVVAEKILADLIHEIKSTVSF